MRIAIIAPVFWLVVAGPADPVAAQVDATRQPVLGETRSAVEVIDARKPQDLLPVSKGMRPPIRNVQLALAATLAAKSLEDETSPKPNDIIIDVVVAYTKKAARNYADIEHELVDLAIEETNRSFRLSNLGHISLRLVHAYQTDYVEDGSHYHFDHVWRFADRGDGYMDEVHGLRDFHRADIAVLFVDDSKGCGLATRLRADADEAFAVVHHACAAANYTLAHEIGHLIGASHELSYVNGTKWRDIMSVKESCVDSTGGRPVTAR